MVQAYDNPSRNNPSRDNTSKDIDLTQYDENGNVKEQKTIGSFLGSIVDTWGRNFFSAAKDAKSQFSDAARDGVKYYGQTHDFVFDERGDFVKGLPSTTINKVDDAVSLFGPSLFFARPRREVAALKGNDDLADVFQGLLNKFSDAHSLEKHSKRAITETIVKAAGVLWTEIHPTTKLPYSRWMPINDIFYDPDVLDFEDAKWVMRRYAMPVWEAKRKWNQTAKGLKPVFARLSDRYNQQAGKSSSEETEDHLQKAATSDNSQPQYVWIYEFWSTIGLGQVCELADSELQTTFKRNRAEMKDLYGVDIKSKNLVITICPTHPIPLAIESWPVPYFKDVSKFPCELLFFKYNMDQLWPKAWLQSSMGLQEMIDIDAAFLMQSSKEASKQVNLALSGISEDIQSAVSRGENNIVIPVSKDQLQGRNLGDVIYQFQTGKIDPNLYNAFKMWVDMYEQSSGLTDILYGQSSRDRETATSVQTRVQSSNIRIDQMVKDVELWQARIAKKEAILAYFTLSSEDVQRILGDKTYGFYIQVSDAGEILSNKQLDGQYPELTGYFQTRDEAQTAINLARVRKQSMGMDIVAHEFEVASVNASKIWEDNAGKTSEFVLQDFAFEIAVGSSRRPNKQEKMDRAMMNLQAVGQIAIQLGQIDVFNQLLTALYEAQEIPDAKRVYLQPPLPQLPMQPEVPAEEGSAAPESPEAAPESEQKSMPVSVENGLPNYGTAPGMMSGIAGMMGAGMVPGEQMPPEVPM